MTPIIEVSAYLSATFVLGLSLGWALWKLGLNQQLKTIMTEKEFWQQRLDQARFERDKDQDKIAALEKERANLKKRVADAAG